MLEMVLAKAYQCTEFKVSSFTRFEFRYGVLKFKNSTLDPDHAPFGGILSLVKWDLPIYISSLNFKFLASPVPNLRKGV